MPSKQLQERDHHPVDNPINDINANQDRMNASDKLTTNVSYSNLCLRLRCPMKSPLS